MFKRLPFLALLQRSVLILYIGFLMAWSLGASAMAAWPGSSQISGIVKDSSGGLALSYATVALYPDTSHVVAAGTTTDDNGAFILSGLHPGVYRIEISLIGYSYKIISHLQLTDAHLSLALGIITMSSASSQLKTVTIVADKPIVEYKPDKIVYNAENDLTSQSGSATDVLKKVPQLSVDVDGNVELAGNNSIQFLINGKSSTMFGNNAADALKAIPANQIKSIEVIGSPGAKYDGSGLGGIINIILKTDKMEGINGSVNLSAGTRLESGSFNLSIKKGKVGFNIFFSGNGQINSVTHTTSRQNSMDSTTGNTTSLLQVGQSDYKRYGSLAGIGLDYAVSKSNNLNFNFGANLGGTFNKGPIDQQLTVTDSAGAPVSTAHTIADSRSRFGFYTFDWSAGYRHLFKKEGQELSLLYSSSHGINSNFYQLMQTHAGDAYPYQGASNSNPGTDFKTEFYLDYAHPFTKFFTLETGAKTVLDHFTSQTSLSSLTPGSDVFTANTAQSYNIRFTRNIYAGYASGSFTFFEHLHFKTGLRYEYTQNIGYFSNAANTHIAPYSTWLPSAMISYDFKKGNQSIKLAYSHRIERPQYRQLNPFVNSADPHNMTTGNPSLLPESSDKVDLTYKKSFEKFVSFSIGALYQRNTHDIKTPITYYPEFTIGDSIYTAVSLSKFANIGSEQKIGGNAYLSIQVPIKMSITINATTFERYVISPQIANGMTKGLEYKINSNISQQLPKDFALEFFINYNSPRIGLQGKYPSFLSYSFAIRKQFLKKTLSVAFTTTNPFGEYVDQTTIINDPIQQYYLMTDRRVPYRSFGLNISYKFGKMTTKKENINPDTGNPFE